MEIIDIIAIIRRFISSITHKNIRIQKKCVDALTTLSLFEDYLNRKTQSETVVKLIEDNVLKWHAALQFENSQKYSKNISATLNDIISFSDNPLFSLQPSQFVTQRDIEKYFDARLKEDILQSVKIILQNQETQLSATLNSNIRTLEDIIASTKEKINTLQTSYIEAKKTTDDYNELETQKIFYLQSKILSEKFNEKKDELKKQKIPYQYVAFSLTGILGILYLAFFFTQYTSNDFNYINHITLICVCTPIIFLDIWLFYQIGRFNHLIEIYTHKANIGFTIKAAIDHIHDIEGDDNNKSTTLTTLHELLNKLYESPISPKDKKSITTKSLSQVTELLKETKELVNTIKPTSDKTNI